MHERVLRVGAAGTYIGRGTPWGNPFRLRRGASAEERESAVWAYADMLEYEPDKIVSVRRELAGQPLVCHCAPELCHGDVLARVAEGMGPVQAFEDATA